MATTLPSDPGGDCAAGGWVGIFHFLTIYFRRLLTVSFRMLLYLHERIATPRREPRGTTMTATTINTESEAYNTGYEAAVQGETRKACPYAAGTWDADNWLAGYDAAK